MGDATDAIYSLTADAHRMNALKITEAISSLADRIHELEEQRRIALAMADYVDRIDAEIRQNAGAAAGMAETAGVEIQRAIYDDDAIIPESGRTQSTSPLLFSQDSQNG